MAGSPRSREGGKVNSEMDAESEPGPLHLRHILRRHSQGDRAHPGPGKGDCPGESLTPDTQHPHSTQPPRAQWAVGWRTERLLWDSHGHLSSYPTETRGCGLGTAGRSLQNSRLGRPR